MFRDLGVPVWCADTEVNKLYEKNGAATKLFSKEFPSVVTEKGVDKNKLRNLIHQDSSILKKIEQIVREEQNSIGAQEMLMPTIQSAEIWKESGRYDDYGEEMLRIKDRQGREMLYGPTNEELITDVFRSSVKSYKSLPQILYHIQWKFRDEIRPRFGVMRCKEFFMKDAYSFDLTDDDAKKSYNKMSPGKPLGFSNSSMSRSS